jgi:hypothetical protein
VIEKVMLPASLPELMMSPTTIWPPMFCALRLTVVMCPWSSTISVGSGAGSTMMAAFHAMLRSNVTACELDALPVSITAAPRSVLAEKPGDGSAYASTNSTCVSTSAVPAAVTVVLVIRVLLAVGLVSPPRPLVEDSA